MSLAPTWLAVAQSSHEPISRGEMVPRLGEIMLGKQWGHIKLWSAGKERNWSLAAYELAQMRASLAEAASLYSGIPLDDVAIMAGPIHSIDLAIESKDSAGFGKAFKETLVIARWGENSSKLRCPKIRRSAIRCLHHQ